MSSEYIKQLESTIELLKKKFEDHSVEMDLVKQYVWNDLTCILPTQEGSLARFLMLVNISSQTNNEIQEAEIKVLTKDYKKQCDDVVTISDIWKILYSKIPSNYFFGLNGDTQKNANFSFTKDEFAKGMYSEFLKASGDIGKETKRGVGNTLVVSDEVARNLISVDNFVFSLEGEKRQGFRTYKLGSLGRFQIFVDIMNTDNKAIVIYNNDNSDKEGAGVLLHNKGVLHWFRPDGYEKYWNIVEIK